MKKLLFLLFVSALLFSACSTGKKAMEKGDYFSAVSKAIQRLKSNSNSKNAIAVVKDSYPMAIQWAQEEIDILLSGNEEFKWDKTFALMEKVNNIAGEIRLSPVGHSIIPNPKVYSSEMDMARNKAAEERYNVGNRQLAENTVEAAKMAYRNFQRTNELAPGFKDVSEKIVLAKDLATIKVILEAIPVNTVKFQLSSEFFYSQIFEYLNNKFPANSFVNFYSPSQAEKFGISYPDFVVKLQFYDFEVGKTEHFEKEETLANRVEVESRDTTKTTYKIYNAKLKTYTDKVSSRGLLDARIVDFESDKLMLDDKIPGEFVWINDYAIFVGDKEALTKNQLELTNRKAEPLPPAQDLFVEFTKPMYDQLTDRLRRFFGKYD